MLPGDRRDPFAHRDDEEKGGQALGYFVLLDQSRFWMVATGALPQSFVLPSAMLISCIFMGMGVG